MPETSDRQPRDSAMASVELNGYLEKFRLRENGGRRLGLDRRIYRFTLHIPERRSGFERRVVHDRRKAPRIASRLSMTPQGG